MKRPATVVLAMMVAVLYGGVMSAVAATVAYQFLSGTGGVGANARGRLAARGVVTVVGLLSAGALALFVGARRVSRGESSALIVRPLVVLLAFGTIGEIADSLGSASPRSDAIGALILILAAVPVALLNSRSAREWRGGHRSHAPVPD